MQSIIVNRSSRWSFFASAYASEKNSWVGFADAATGKKVICHIPLSAHTDIMLLAAAFPSLALAKAKLAATTVCIGSLNDLLQWRGQSPAQCMDKDVVSDYWAEAEMDEYTVYATYGNDSSIEIGEVQMPESLSPVEMPQELEINGVSYFPQF
ncbi:MAG: hypothetical protein JRC93_13910 [Deltaproteobacteria bacterium]|nr:hypothetical protein [Deltaproteobacteria bacterium]